MNDFALPNDEALRTFQNCEDLEFKAFMRKMKICTRKCNQP